LGECSSSRGASRAVDSSGQTIDFLLTAKHDTAAAKRFFQRGMANPAIRYRGRSTWIGTAPTLQRWTS
jgi:transposase-like protein